MKTRKRNNTTNKSTKALPGEKNPKVGITPNRSIPSVIRLLPPMVIILAYTLMYLLLRGKILFTPDFDRSDAFHLNVSLKYYLWETLHQNALPFWTQKLQGGFPLLAEGQIGALYLPNLILYRLLSFPDAYMLTFVGSLFLFTLGIYLLLVKAGIRKSIALLLGLSAAFAGFITYRWVHFNLIQTVSLLPFLFLSAGYAYQEKSFWGRLLHSFIIAETIYAGHIQVAFLSFLSLALWYLVMTYTSNRLFLFSVRKTIADMAPLFALGFLLAMPQLLPTLQLMQFSGRTQQSGYEFATSYSYSFRHIISFLTPYFFGNPQQHTYPLSLSQWGVFWENTPYIGELLFLVISVSIVYLIVTKSFLKHRGILYLFLSGCFLVLSLGSNSPLYFIFDLPPFSFFRTPAKYLIPSAFFLILGGAMFIEDFLKSIRSRFWKLCIYSALFLNIVILVKAAFSYHVFEDYRPLMIKEAVTVPLKQDDRYLTFGFGDWWSKQLSRHGWISSEDIKRYKDLNSAIIPDSNFMYGGECFDINTGGLRLRRIDMINNILTDFFSASDSAQTATDSAMNLVSLAGINTFISTESLPVLNTYGFSSFRDAVGFYHYHQGQDAPGFYLPKIIRNLEYSDDFNELYADAKVSTGEAVVEGYQTESFNQKPSVTVSQNSDIAFRASVLSSGNTFFVIAKNWYPEWHVRVDGQEVKPIKTNLIHMGIEMEAGKHTVEAKYVPDSFLRGVLLAFAALLIYLAFYGLRKAKGRK